MRFVTNLLQRFFDNAMDLVLDGIEKAQAAQPRDNTRHGIVHCQITRPDQALDSFTKAGAYATFGEHTKGEIQPGMLADFVLLGAAPFRTNPDKLKDIPILQTWLDGELVCEKVTENAYRL